MQEESYSKLRARELARKLCCDGEALSNGPYQDEQITDLQGRVRGLEMYIQMLEELDERIKALEEYITRPQLSGSNGMLKWPERMQALLQERKTAASL